MSVCPICANGRGYPLLEKHEKRGTLGRYSVGAKLGLRYALAQIRATRLVKSPCFQQLMGRALLRDHSKAKIVSTDEGGFDASI